MRIFCFLLFSFACFIAYSQQTIRNTVYFDFDSDEPTVLSKTELSSFIKQLKDLPVNSVSVYGYTDKKGTKTYNRELAADRAAFISQFLKNILTGNIVYNNYSFGEDSLLATDDERQYINRRVEIVVVYTLPEKKLTTIEPFYEDVEEQRFTIDLDDTVSITAKEGTGLKIVPGSIQTKRRVIAKGKAELIIKEYYDTDDILLAGLNTNSEKGLLQTGGMFYMTIIQNGDTMSAETKKTITVRMPVKDAASGNNMNVFTMNHNTDTALWNNSGRVFNRLFRYWEWPTKMGKLKELLLPEISFELWPIGRKFTDDYKVAGDWFLNSTPWTRPDAKRIINEVTRTDSNTLQVSLRIRFRDRGARKFHTRNFDTTFLVKYRRAQYEGFISGLNWINCDRFLDYPNVSNFYVSTPEFKGANVLVYFKNIKAFMPAYDNGNETYEVSRVPAGEDVWLIAFGKKDNDYYFSKKKFTIDRGVTESLALTKLSEEDFRKEMKSFR